MTDRPVPVADELSAPYWEAARRHESVLPRCAACGRCDLPPEIVCRRCGSATPDWHYQPVSGRGTVRSWTVVRRSFLPSFETPFVLVDVEVEEEDDLRVIGRLLDTLDVDDPGLQIGTPVRTVFEDVGDDHAVPAFRLVIER